LPELLAVGRGAALVGVDDRLRRCRRLVAEEVVVGAAHERDVASSDRDRLAVVGHEPGAAAQHRDHAQRRLVLDPDRPGRIQGAAEQEGAPRARPVEQPGDRIHSEDSRRSRIQSRRATIVRLAWLQLDWLHDHSSPATAR
jgi:hypothetical protein